MRFDEMIKKLNEKIVKEGKTGSKSFGNKDDLKRWLCGSIREIVGKELMKQDWNDENDKFSVDYSIDGRENYVTIKYEGAYVGEVKFKYTYYTEYQICWTYTRYGIKSVSFEKGRNAESDNFKDCKDEMIKYIAEQDKDHKEYVEKKLKECKKFVDKLESCGMSFKEIEKKISELKYVYRNFDWEEKEKINEIIGIGKDDYWY